MMAWGMKSDSQLPLLARKVYVQLEDKDVASIFTPVEENSPYRYPVAA
jgi:hypothetical protein